MPEQLEHVLFDLDGTLVDSAPGVVWAIRTAWHRVCPQVPMPDLQQLIGPPIRTIFRQASPDLNAAMIESLVSHYRCAYDSEGWRQTSVYPGVLEALGELKKTGVCCWGVTNKPAVPTRLVLEHCGLREFFHEFLSIDSRTPPFASKIEAAQALMTQHGIRASASRFVGDTLEDAHTAVACGLPFLAFQGGYGWLQLQRHLPIGSSFGSFGVLPACLRSSGSSLG